MSDSAPSIHIRMAANLGGLELARLQARHFLETHVVEPATVAAVELVLEECITNTLRYGYSDTGLRWIEFALALQTHAVALTIEDDAGQFDPLSQPEPVLPTTLDEARVGGLGLLMLRRSAQRLEYERVGGRNRLSVTIPRLPVRTGSASPR